MKLVILDSYALTEGDLDFSPLHAMVDEAELYPRTAPDEVIPRLAGADFAIVNKVNINEEVLAACPRLQWVGVTATGTDSLDIAACRRHGVPVANVPGYSTDSVAQLAVCLMLNLCQSPAAFDAAIRGGYWQLGIPAQYGILPQMELAGKTLGIVGYGAIAQRVAAIAAALGMRVVCTAQKQRSNTETVAFVPLERLLTESDIISLHCPATPSTRNLLNADTLAGCKRGVRIINTARGALVDDAAMANALHAGQVSAFAADVVSKEPIAQDNPLLCAPHVLLTPHIAWATPASLARLAAETVENLRAHLAGETRNIVN